MVANKSISSTSNGSLVFNYNTLLAVVWRYVSCVYHECPALQYKGLCSTKTGTVGILFHEFSCFVCECTTYNEHLETFDEVITIEHDELGLTFKKYR